MFAILGSLEKASFLDLFAGSASIGIEAASRGASPIHLVEKDPAKKRTILGNLQWVESETRLFLTPAEKFLRGVQREYDFIHLDPPFPLPGKENFLSLIEERAVLKKGGTLTFHYPGEENFSETIGSLRLYEIRGYGRSKLSFYTRD